MECGILGAPLVGVHQAKLEPHVGQCKLPSGLSEPQEPLVCSKGGVDLSSRISVESMHPQLPVLPAPILSQTVSGQLKPTNSQWIHPLAVNELPNPVAGTWPMLSGIN